MNYQLINLIFLFLLPLFSTRQLSKPIPEATTNEFTFEINDLPDPEEANYTICRFVNFESFEKLLPYTSSGRPLVSDCTKLKRGQNNELTATLPSFNYSENFQNKAFVAACVENHYGVAVYISDTKITLHDKIGRAHV